MRLFHAHKLIYYMSEFMLFKGQKRSGNHLVINWLLSMCENPCFKNDCMYNSSNNTVSKENVLRTLQSLEPGHDCYLLSVEALEFLDNKDIEEIINLAESKSELGITKSLSPTILRDPINWYASYIKKNNQEVEELMFQWVAKNYEKIWKIYRSGLYHYKHSNFKVDYNQFTKDVNYRKEICSKFGKNFDEAKDAKTVNTLWQPQGVYPASSFDNNEVFNGDKDAVSMKVTERYRTVINVFSHYPVPEDIVQETKDLWPELPIERINRKFKAF